MSKIHGREMCEQCYHKDPEVKEMIKLSKNKRVHRPCIKCGVLTLIVAREMCEKCYRRDPEVSEMKKLAENQRVHIPCIKCHVLSQMVAHSMCSKCYRRDPEVKDKIRLTDMQREPRRCVKCQQVSKIHAREMCERCYRQTPDQKRWRELYRTEWAQRPTNKICIKCEEPRQILALGMCQMCYRQCTRCMPGARNLELTRQRNRTFLLSDKPVGAFDPIQMQNDSLLKAYSEVIAGKLDQSSTSKRKSRYDIDWSHLK